MVNLPEDEERDMYKFEIYRPPKTSGRLEGIYVQHNDRWRPSLSYKYTLHDIKHQFTPAENFRHELATRGKHIRMIQRLELRIKRRLERYTNAALKIQALFRGNQGRLYFATIRDDLKYQLHRREAKTEASNCFDGSDFVGTIAAVDRLDPPIIQFMELKIKSQYRLGRYDQAVATCKYTLEIDLECEPAYFIQACSFVTLGQIDTAYDILKQLMINVEQPQRESYRLCGYVAAKVEPPLFMEAVDSYSTLIKKDAHDFEVLLERACCYNCLQEWRSSLKDLNFILAFYPNYIQALLLRARAYACIREWKRARDDYKLVLMNDPSNETAQKGLEDVAETSSELPMLDSAFIDNEDG